MQGAYIYPYASQNLSQRNKMKIKTINNYISRDLKLIHVIQMFPYQNLSNEEHAQKNQRVFLLIVLPTCVSPTIPMHEAPLRFSCMQLMHVPCTSRAHDLCMSKCYSPSSKEVLYTQDLSPNDSKHNLGTPKCGFQKGGSYDSLSLEVKDNSHQKSLGNLNP